MTFEQYQKKSRGTAVYPEIEDKWVYPVLGLAGEAGEVANKVKKVWRDDHGVITGKKRQEVKEELGDVLWYLAQIATDFGLCLEEVAEYNLKKLYSRKERGVLTGDGDHR